MNNIFLANNFSFHWIYCIRIVVGDILFTFTLLQVLLYSCMETVNPEFFVKGMLIGDDDDHDDIIYCS